MGRIKSVIVTKGLRIYTCPKVATGTIESATHGAYPRHTFTDEPGDEYRWMCVRHPLDRLVSCWAFFCGNELEIAGQGLFQAVGYYYGMSFDDFLALALERHAENQHTQPQADFTGPYPLDRVCRLENLSEEWKRLQKKFPYLTRPLLSIHKTDHKPWKHYYTDDQQRRAESVFAADLELYQRGEA